MALSRAAGLCRLALRTQWAATRLLSTAASGIEEPDVVDGLRPERSDLAAVDTPRRDRGSAASGSEQPAGVERLRHDRGHEASRPALGVAVPTREQVQLNKTLTACGTVDGVLDLMTEHVSRLNCVNVSTALLAIQRRRSERETAEWLKGDARFRQLLKVARRQMEGDAMDAQALSNVLYVCGELGTRPPPSWLTVYWDASGAALPDMVPQALSNTLYAMQKMQVMPPPGWLERYWEASIVKLPEFNAQDCSNTMYSAGQLVRAPLLAFRCFQSLTRHPAAHQAAR